MKRTVILLAVLVGFAMSANAATLVLSDNSGGTNTYNVGDTIILTLTGNSTTYTEKANTTFARLEYENALTIPVTASTIGHTQGPPTKACPGGCEVTTIQASVNEGMATIGFAHMLEMIISGTGTPASVNTTSTAVSTATLVAEAAGVLNVNFFVDPTDTLKLTYFGITSASGVTFLIVPEPTTAALIGLGLVGLVLGGRRRA